MTAKPAIEVRETIGDAALEDRVGIEHELLQGRIDIADRRFRRIDQNLLVKVLLGYPVHEALEVRQFDDGAPEVGIDDLVRLAEIIIPARQFGHCEKPSLLVVLVVVVTVFAAMERLPGVARLFEGLQGTR